MSNIDEIIQKVPGLSKYRNSPRAVEMVYEELTGVKKPISKWSANDRISDYEFLLVKLNREYKYVGCPKCRKKFDGESGVSFTCSKCNSPQTSQLLEWRVFYASDTEGGLILFSLPPKFDSSLPATEMIGKIVRANGFVTNFNEDKEFGKIPELTINAFKIIDDIKQINSSALEHLQSSEIESPSNEIISEANLLKLRTFFAVMKNRVTKEKLEMFLHNKTMTIEDVMPLLVEEETGFFALKQLKD